MMTYDASEFKGLVKSLSFGGKKHNEIGNRFVGVLVRGSNDLQKALPKGASSNLSNSVYQSSEIDPKGFAGVVGSRAPYGMIAAETGRKPGSIPPVKALERWAQQKFGDKKAAYAIAKSIKKKGTRRYREKGPQLITIFENKLSNFAIPLFIKDVIKIIQK